MLAAGSLMDERYRLLRQLGEGAHGAVWLAEDIHLKRSIAIKFVRSGFEDNGLIIARLQREAKALQRLDHPNVVQVFRIGSIASEAFFLALEYVPGSDLDSALENGPLPVAEAVHFARQIADGMLEAEKHALVHRDLKPQNILLLTPAAGGMRQVKIADFGLCTSGVEATLQFGALTSAGTALGTPLYMSPEQCQGKTSDVRSDIYSFGCVLYEMLTGFPPYRGGSTGDLMMMHVRDPLPDLLDSTNTTNVTRHLRSIIQKCMAKLPAERYQSFAEVSADLASISESDTQQPLQIRAAKKPGRKWRNTLAPLAVAGVVTAFAGALAATVYLSTEEQKVQFALWAVTLSNSGDLHRSIFKTIDTVEAVSGTRGAQSFALASLETPQFRSLPPDQQLTLIRDLSDRFRRVNANLNNALPFANALLERCLSEISELVQNGNVISAGAQPPLGGHLRYILSLPWSEAQWKELSRTLSHHTGVLNNRQIANLSNAETSYVLEELLAESIVHSNAQLDFTQRQRVNSLYFDAAGRALNEGDFAKARHYAAKLQSFGHDKAIHSWIALIGRAANAGDLRGARTDFQTVSQLRGSRPFSDAALEAGYQECKTRLYPIPR